ncbi:hypothetical protein [Mammaliicoccus sciuri]|uniref:hypothetical protein n=1 Tax=Mammaliicoccus sciuri TaxID=1296 RepID=UPI003F571FC7
MAKEKQQPQKPRKKVQTPNAFHHFVGKTMKVKFLDDKIVNGKLISYTPYEIILEVTSKTEVSRMIVMKQSIKWAKEVINPESNTEEE